MANSAFQIPTEFNVDKARDAAGQALSQSRAAFERINAATKGSYGSLDASASIAAKGLSELNAKAFEAFQANTALAFDYFNALTGTKTISDILALTPAHANKQFQALKDQSKDLSTLAQKIVTESAEPLKHAIGKTFQPLV